jgi:hypothetical protein
MGNGLLADLLSYIDARKRVAGSNLADIRDNPRAALTGLLSTPPEAVAERERKHRETSRRLESGGGVLGGSVMPGVDKVTDSPEFEAAMNAPLGLLGTIAPKRPIAKIGAHEQPSGLFSMPMSDDYKGLHTAPLRDSGSPLHNLSNTYPDDIYGPYGARYYGHYGGDNRDDLASVGLIQSFKDKPNATVTIYRAVPHEPSAQEQLVTLEKQMAAFMRRGIVPDDSGKSVGWHDMPDGGKGWYDRAVARREALRSAPAEAPAKLDINPGDWVTINRNYAKEHGESTLNGKYKIVKKTVRAKDIYTNGDSIHEWGYDPTP